MTTTKPWSQLHDAIEDTPEHTYLAAQFRRAMVTAEALGQIVDDCSEAPGNGAEDSPRLQIMHDEDEYLTALRYYVNLLGGHLEINAVFPDRTVQLVPAEDDETSPAEG